jgi:hypothetical protein
MPRRVGQIRNVRLDALTTLSSQIVYNPILSFDTRYLALNVWVVMAIVFACLVGVVLVVSIVLYVARARKSRGCTTSARPGSCEDRTEEDEVKREAQKVTVRNR